MRRIPEVVQATLSYGRQLGLDALSQIVDEAEGDQTNRNSCGTGPLGRSTYLSRDCYRLM